MTVLISHVGIEGAVLTRAKANAKVKEETARLKAKHQGKILIAGLDPCQRLSGIALKLLAFERLLTEYECYRDTVVMVQRSLLSGSRHEDEEATGAEVRELVARVNSKFGACRAPFRGHGVGVCRAGGWVGLGGERSYSTVHALISPSPQHKNDLPYRTGPVIDYEELRAPNLPIHDRIALWLASDVLVISAIRCVQFA